MNGNSVFLDTNIVLYLLSGDATIAELLHEKTIFISFVSELELLGYKDATPQDLKRIEVFLSEANIIDISTDIKKIIIGLRKSYKIKLPDAIIVASAHYLNLPLLTSDKDLSKLSEVNILLYEK